MQIERLLVHSSGKSWDHEYCWVEVGSQHEPRITPEGKSLLSRSGLVFDQPAFALFRELNRPGLTVAIAGLVSSHSPNRDGRIFNAVIYLDVPDAEARGLAKSISSDWSDIEASVDKAVVFDNAAQAGFRVDTQKLEQLCIRAERGDARLAGAARTRKMSSGELANWFATTEFGSEFQSVVCRRKEDDWEYQLSVSPISKPSAEGVRPPFDEGEPESQEPVQPKPIQPETTEAPKDRKRADVERKYGIKPKVIVALVASLIVGYLLAKLVAPQNEKKKFC
jgi:hypothetical protein